MIRTCVGCKYIELSAHERFFNGIRKGVGPLQIDCTKFLADTCTQVARFGT